MFTDFDVPNSPQYFLTNFLDIKFFQQRERDLNPRPRSFYLQTNLISLCGHRFLISQFLKVYRQKGRGNGFRNRPVKPLRHLSFNLIYHFLCCLAREIMTEELSS